MSNSDGFLFLIFLLVTFFAFFIPPQIDDFGEREREGWEIFFEGNLTEAVIFPNGEEGEVFLGQYTGNYFRVVEGRENNLILNSSLLKVGAVGEKESSFFMDDDLALSTEPKKSSWKILIFADENKFVAYQKR